MHNTFEEIRGKINDSLTGIAKCYILINYAYNTEEETITYKKEFKKRYVDFYKLIIETEEDIDRRFMNGLNEPLKKLLNIEFYKPEMTFLKQTNIDEIKGTDEDIDADYERKASMSVVKLNFYHNNNVEYGSTTRFHVNTTKYGVVDPVAHSEEESIYLFSTLTNYYINNLNNVETDDKQKKLTKNM